MEHGGRIQVQGASLEASRSWDQATPLPASTGYDYPESLKTEIGKRERELRQRAFAKARLFIDQMLVQGGTDPSLAPFSKSFRVRGDDLGRRVDIDIFRGRAFVPDPIGGA